MLYITRVLAGCILLTLAVTWAGSSPARAVTPDEVLSDPQLEARARNLSQMLRCVVCQNQSIDDSTAPLARDLRVLVRERLQGGDSDRQALSFIVDRYGNFVLLKPPFQWNTMLLWIGPAFLLLAAVTSFGAYLQRARQRLNDSQNVLLELSDDENERLDAILTEGHSP